MKKAMNLDKILDTATALINEHGLNYLTMQHLAKSLNVRSQSLYYYVANRSELLSLVAAKRLESLRQKLLQDIVGLSGKKAIIRFADDVRNFLLQDKAIGSTLYSLNELKLESAINEEVEKILALNRKIDIDRGKNLSVHALMGAVVGYIFFDQSKMFADEDQETADRNYHEMILRLVGEGKKSSGKEGVSIA